MKHLHPPSAFDRRAFLRHVALLGAGTALAACGDGSAAAPSEAPTASTPADPAAAAIAGIAPDADPSLAVVAATFEQLIDQPNPFVFGLFTLEQQPIDDASAEVYAVPPQGDPLGPWPAEPSDADVPPGGLYSVKVEFAVTGLHEIVVVTDDGRAGAVAIEVRDAESSQLPAPGDQAQAVPTPTEANPLGYERLCTRSPEPCGMHEVSLDEALAGDGPVVVLFATPAYCQTAVCGPTVDVLERVRGDYGDVTFIHCEIFADAGETLGDPVTAWNLPTEPWLFLIDPDGRIARRADGPLLVVPEQVRSLLDEGLSSTS